MVERTEFELPVPVLNLPDEQLSVTASKTTADLLNGGCAEMPPNQYHEPTERTYFHSLAKERVWTST
jgi:hypothetical protein